MVGGGWWVVGSGWWIVIKYKLEQCPMQLDWCRKPQKKIRKIELGRAAAG